MSQNLLSAAVVIGALRVNPCFWIISDSVGDEELKKETVTYENALKNIGMVFYFYHMI